MAIYSVATIFIRCLLYAKYWSISQIYQRTGKIWSLKVHDGNANINT